MNYRVAVVVFLLVASYFGGAVGVSASTVPSSADLSPVGGDRDRGLEGRSSPAAAAVGSNAVDSTGATAERTDVLHRTTVLRHLPERTGTFETETTFRVPESVTEFEIDLEAEASVEATEGFEPRGDGTYRWDGDTDRPTIRYTMPADRTGYDRRHDHDRSADARTATRSFQEGYTFTDQGEWGIVQVPAIGVSYRYTEPVGLQETVTVDGPGAAGDDVAFFGAVAEYERTADGQTIRLAVPAAADLRERPDDVLETLTAASASLGVGATREEVFVVAVPSDVDWAARGIQYGEADAWVVADAPLAEPSNVWLHEYVHTRQTYANPATGTTTETRWFAEGQAEYYAATLALEQGLIDADEYRAFLARGERSPYADGVLADPASWHHERTDYVKGPLVAGEIDRRIRVATDGDRTLADVVRTLNARNDRVTERAFLEAVEDAGGADVRAAAERYTRTARSPELWTRADHADAFDRRRPAIVSGLDGPLEVAGESAPADDATDVVAVPAGESVTVPVAVENVGDGPGTADATLQVDGTIVDSERFALEAGDRTTEGLTWTPSTPGEYAVRAGDDRFTVLVRAPSSVRVTDLSLDPDRVDPGDPVTVTATVTAADSRPGATVLAFRTDGGTDAERPVSVAPGERVTVEATLTFADGGRHEVAVGSQSVTVTVGSGLSGLERISGFGAPAAVAALAAAVAVLARRS